MFIQNKSWLEKSAKQELHVIFSSAVADPGKGPGGPSSPLLIFRPNKGAPPLLKGLDPPLFRDLFRQVRHIQQGLDEAGSVTYKMIKMLWIGLRV